MRHLFMAAAAATAIATVPTLAPAQGEGSCGEATITEMSWASASVVTAVATFLMDQGYGCDVTKVPSSITPALASVAETGEPDILTELWVNSAPVYDRLVEEGKLEPLTRVLSDGSVQGWYVPDYLLEEHPELGTLDGVLKNPDLLDNRFHNCPDGWDCRTVNDNILAAAGFEDAGFEIFDHGSGETLASSIASAHADEAPWIGYYWSPTAILGRYPMTRIDMGGFDADAHACNETPDCADPQVSAYPNADVFTVVTDSFAEAEPEVTDMLRNMQFTNDQMNAVLAWKDENTASNEEAAVHFLTSYQDVWSDWLNDAARERLSNVLNQ
ncbi:ABC transporter substrate-binding protein [Roseivivax sediminis]|uniref:Glycine betaine/proline transport system substrate-binding protein n=1 Tax=Roseivivax sediminis TaxID=936889 RepID=A0A1I1XNX0_9RHOB|nr:ABC transporter substrate-binding protein [Roseivivax sediminis]SFE09039.1 glycine betaine/proline transport system substrate-binding protein [Roseivivax sediminis]